MVNQKRNRTVAARQAANAADTSIAATLADHRRGASLAIVTNQPAANTTAQYHSQASDIACIVRENKRQYLVRYTQPAANPAVQHVSKSWLEKQAAHVHVVQAWREEQQLQQEQQRLADTIDIVSPNDWLSTSDSE